MPVRERLKLATITMNSLANKADNLAAATSLIREAAAAGADWVLLPEVFSYMGPYDGIYAAAETSDGPLNEQLSALARQLGITLFAGSVPERPSAADEAKLGPEALYSAHGVRRVYNTFYAFDAQGRLFAKYRKTHLFELRDEAGQQTLYCETEGFLAGNELLSFTHEGWQVGCAICYDLRFPELFTSLARPQPLDLLLVPAAFTYATGERHWQLLLTARAVEQQCYVMAANQTGEHGPGKKTWGHSMVVDPWGAVLANSQHQAGVVYATIDKQTIAQYRSKLPAIHNRRRELYSV